jgi:hypothetical protein
VNRVIVEELSRVRFVALLFVHRIISNMWQWRWIARHLPKAYKQQQQQQQPIVSKKASKVIAQELIDYLPEYHRKSTGNRTVESKQQINELPEYYKFIKFVEKYRLRVQERQNRL